MLMHVTTQAREGIDTLELQLLHTFGQLVTTQAREGIDTAACILD